MCKFSENGCKVSDFFSNIAPISAEKGKRPVNVDAFRCGYFMTPNERYFKPIFFAIFAGMASLLRKMSMVLALK